MGERLPPRSEQRQKPQEGWPVGQIAEALQATPEAVEDPLFGDGIQYRIGESGVVLTTWESRGFIRVGTDEDELLSRDLDLWAADFNVVIFRGKTEQRKKVEIWNNGQLRVTFPSFPSSRPASDFPAPPLDSQPAPATELAPAPSPIQPGDEELDAPPPAEQAEQREKSNRVELMGNVAWEPKYREFQSGNKRLQFSVALHHEDGSTEYRLVKAFRDRADKYNGHIHKGDAVRIVGGRAYETVTDKQGKQQQREFVILWGLKPLGEGRP